MTDSDASRVIHLADAQARIPGPSGEHAISVLRRGTLDIALSIPDVPKRQTPHTQDELYLILRGRGVLLHSGKREPIGEGDLVFVAAGVEHQFEELRDHFAVWRVFYGPHAGDAPRRVPAGSSDSAS